MPGKWTLIFLLIFLGSCQKTAQVIQDEQGRFLIQAPDIGVQSAEVLDWNVGPMFKQKVSKGIILKLTFPRLDKKDLIRIIKEKKVDAWLIRLSKSYYSGKDVVGHIYMPFQAPSMRDIVQNTTGHFSIYYAAASPSPRFENFYCPAFGHNLVIDPKAIKLDRGREKISSIVLGSYMNEYLPGKVYEFSLKTVSVNGGMKLEGTYYLELAAYNVAEKMVKSRFIEFPGQITVSNETTKQINGCLGVNNPTSKDPEPDNKWWRFKFGR